MAHPIHHQMTKRLLEQIETKTYPAAPEVQLPAARYTDATWHEKEVQQLFRRRPLVVAHSSQLAEPGSCVTVDQLGIGAILVRDDTGKPRAFLNACRHRGTRLVNDAQCQLKRFVCPYHKWSYNLTGELTGVPHKRTFATLDTKNRGLIELPVAERHGLIWLLADRNATLSLDDYLGPINDELDALGLANHVVHKVFTCEREANWKLVMDAFLEAYHIKTLHNDTLARFFCDARTLVDQVGEHLRAVTARKAILGARETPPDQWSVRDLVTPSYVLFPNTVLIAHPDYISVITVLPLAPGRLHWTHRMMIPEAAQNDTQRKHWDRTLQLIEETVFQKEDLHVAELIQRGLQTGANDTLLFGQLEYAVPWFHRTIDKAIGTDFRESDAGTPSVTRHR